MKITNKFIREKYLRNLPTKFCPGCGNGIILNCFARAVELAKIPIDSIVCVSGIGCASWIPSPYFNSDTMHVTHGRALAFATGIKIFDPKLNVVVFSGDGDGLGIGGNHFIHACRRNINITFFLVNNGIYGMTGGQVAPTTPYLLKTRTTPFGNPEEPFNVCKLAIASGATYVARWSTFHARQLIKSMKEALTHQGFSMVEIVSQCPTQFGRFKRKSGIEIFKGFESLEVGVFKRKIAPELVNKLQSLGGK
jgi:2-oxoglutarate ferredoxin oxidoreductase subunit beta